MPSCKYVLILDDNELSLRIIAQFFDTINWCVLRCRNMQAALNAVLDNPQVCMVMTDFAIGEKQNGADFVRHVRQFEKESQVERAVPIIGFSAYNQAREAFMEAGATHYLPKPLRHDDILRAITTYCH